MGETPIKAITGIFVMFLVSVLGRAQQPQPPAAETAKAKAPPNYYPLKVGSKWHYQVEMGNGQKAVLVNEIAKIENIDGKDLARLETVGQGNVQATEHLSSNAQGIFRNRYNDLELSPPVCLLKYPIQEGETWTTQTKVGDLQLTIIGREGRTEEVQVPAGKYQAVTAVVETTVDGKKIRTSYWFAADVGIVKQTIDLGDQVINRQLVKYEEPQ